MINRISVLVCMALFMALVGCSESEPEIAAPEPENAPVEVAEPSAPTPSHELKVVVPEEVRDQWKSVKIAVRDLQTGSEDIYTVDIGGSFQLPADKLKVTVETFLPAFIMDGQVMTSASNRATNPAARILIEQQGQQVFRGWLFGLYPDTHAFQHSRYNFTLLGYKPAG